ncbi:MAG: hypothetical protein ACI8RZ_002165 [Myxococcota bacterium]|jgi:hypothetical protein
MALAMERAVVGIALTRTHPCHTAPVLMQSPLSSLLATWQHRDLARRLGEAAIRGVCWGLLIVAVAPDGLGLIAGGVALVGEALWCWRSWRGLEAIADAVDVGGDTHGLLRTALSAEQDQAWGSPELIDLVKQQASTAAPALAVHAVRGLRVPRAPLAVGLLGLLLLSLPGQTDEAAEAAEALASTDTPSTNPDDPEQERTAGLSPSSSVLDGEGAMAGGEAKAQAERGEGEAGATGAAGGGAASGEARQGAQGAGGAGEEGGRPTGQSSSAEGGSASGDNTQTGGEQRGKQAEADESSSEDPDAMALAESAMREGRGDGSIDPYGNEQDSVQSVDQDRMEKHYTELDNAVGAGTMAPENNSALTQDVEETPTNTLGLALAGQGGINDAPGTVDLAGDPEADDVETTEAWIAARWRSSAAGTLQTIDGGQSGGQSGQAWVELYGDYAALAEARMHREEIPPGRRDYVRTYFESIRSEP